MGVIREKFHAARNSARLTMYRLAFAAAFLGFGYIIINAVHLQPAEQAMRAAIDAGPSRHVLLQTGGQADLIRGIQRELAALGYDPGTANGIENRQTRAAIWAWQYDNQLPLTGRGSQLLLKQLLFGTPTPQTARPERAAAKASATLVKPLEKILAELGYAPGPVDGVFDQRTRKAVLAFEKDREMAPTGRISGRLVAELRRIINAHL